MLVNQRTRPQQDKLEKELRLYVFERLRRNIPAELNWQKVALPLRSARNMVNMVEASIDLVCDSLAHVLALSMCLPCFLLSFLKF